MYDLETERILHSRDVVFDESRIGIEKIQIEYEKRWVQIEYPVSEEETSSQNSNENERTNEEESEEIDPCNEDSGGAAEPELRRSTRERKHPDYHGAWLYSAETMVREPVTVNEALSSSERGKWKKQWR